LARQLAWQLLADKPVPHLPFVTTMTEAVVKIVVGTIAILGNCQEILQSIVHGFLITLCFDNTIGCMLIVPGIGLWQYLA
jgi:hypothetical protein